MTGYTGLFPVAIPDIAQSISFLTLKLPSVSVYVVTPTQPAPVAYCPPCALFTPVVDIP